MTRITDRIGRVPRPGDVYWLDEQAVPTQSRAHPHVVVAHDAGGGTVQLCALSTRVQRASEPGNVLLDPGEAHLPHPSIVIVSRTATVEAHRLGAYVGTLREGRVTDILAGMRFQQALIGTRP